MLRVVKKIGTYIQSLEQRPAMVGCLLLVVSCVFFVWLQWSPTFADPDSFYHIKIAELMRDQRGFVTKFPWLPHTVLAENFADQAWLYHVFLIPFTYFPDPLIGFKVATGLLDVTLMVCIYWIMKKWNIKHAWVYIVILLLTNPFIFRISLAKTPAISVLMFLIGLYVIVSKGERPFAITFIGLISLIFVWTHAAWPLLIITSVIYWIVNGFITFKDEMQKNHQTIKQCNHVTIFTKSLFAAPEKKLSLATILGSLLGLMINPYFPQNLSFFWYQTILIGLKSYKHVIEVGSEWYGFPLAELIGSSVFVSSAVLIAVVVFFLRIRHQTAVTWTFLLTSAALLLLTLSARRNSEYFIPVAILFSAATLSKAPRLFWTEWWRSFCFLPLVRGSLRGGVGFQNVYGDIKCYPRPGNTPSHTVPGRPPDARRQPTPLLGGGVWLALLLFFSLTIPFIMIRDTLRIKHLLSGRYALTKLTGASAWLEENLPAGSTIFNAGWEDFPPLMYHAPQFRYIIGLDPTFLYIASPEKYHLWHDLSEGTLVPDPARVAEAFDSGTFVVEKIHTALHQQLSTRSDWKSTYEDEEVWIYQTQK